MSQHVYPELIPAELLKAYETDFYKQNQDKFFPVWYYIERDFFRITEAKAFGTESFTPHFFSTTDLHGDRKLATSNDVLKCKFFFKVV